MRAPLWFCQCGGCWACEGNAPECTCDVDWDAITERNLGL